MKPFVVSYELYPFDVLVCLGSKRSEIDAFLKAKDTILTQEEDAVITLEAQALGRCILLGGGQTVLLTRHVPKRGCGALSHEIFHAVEMLFERIGMPLSRSSSEAYAYAIQFLTDKINARIRP